AELRLKQSTQPTSHLFPLLAKSYSHKTNNPPPATSNSSPSTEHPFCHPNQPNWCSDLSLEFMRET
ncbi:unnamed protein product, partial [Ceratitis capitata]